MFHATAPIALILSPGQEIIPAIAINLIIHKAPGILFPGRIIILPFTIFHLIFELTFINVPVIVSDTVSVLFKMDTLQLVELKLGVLLDCCWD
jgi:hypothetical protein